MGEAGVAEGRGEGAGEGDEQQRPHDALRREDGRQGRAPRRAEVQVDGARGRGEQGLDRVEEDGVLEDLGRARGPVGRRRELLLQVGPCQAGRAQRKNIVSHSKLYLYFCITGLGRKEHVSYKEP